MLASVTPRPQTKGRRKGTPSMDATRLPAELPATVVRPRPLIEAVMAQSLSERGPDSRTIAAWR